MDSNDLQRQLTDIESRIEAIHAAIVGGLDGKPGLVQRVAELDQRVARLESLTGWAKTSIGGAVAAIISAYALMWGGPHGH